MVGFGLGKRAGRGALRLLKRSARVGRGLVAQRGMGPDVVVVVAPEGQFAAAISQAVEDFLVQAFVAQAAVDGEDGPAPEKGPYTGPILQKEHTHEPSHRGP